MSGGPRVQQAATWGWHRLESDWAQKIVDEAHVRPGELVVDVGAGNGALTFPLLRAGARVIAVELHPRRAASLRERLAGENAVVLTMDIADFGWPSRPVRVVANPPFATTSLLLRALLSHRWLMAADLVLPRRIVARYTHDRRTRRLPARRGLDLPRSAFRPRPPVDCGVLQLRRDA